MVPVNANGPEVVRTTTPPPLTEDIQVYPADEKRPTRLESAFEKLPDEIIILILQLTTPNVFASLIVLNRKWRLASQQAHLYAHHLSRCPSYSAAHPGTVVPEDDPSLPRLRRLFAREIKRNLFEAYLRPKETIINLVSTSISSSSAPGGEAFHFSLSPRGHYILAYSSSRIHVLDVRRSEVEVKRELKILRRPASTTITDDGSLLAVLSTDMQVDLYDLTSEPPKHTRSVALDHTPRTITLSPTGSVLACAYDAGVEVSSLEPDCMNNERRAVKCYAVDSLSFSKDGTQLLGTTNQSRNPSTVVLTAPYYDPGGNLPEESTSALWTTSILFPNGSRDCSHAVLLPSSTEDEASWAFTYDRVFETFRAVRIDDLRNGTTYFTGPTAQSHLALLPSTLPAASEAGDLVVSGFQGSIWIYGVPEDLEAIPKVIPPLSTTESETGTPLSQFSQLARRNSAPSLRSITRHRSESHARIPQWQLLCDKFRNNFVEGRKISVLDRVSAMTWVNSFAASSHEERLVAVAPGVGGLPPESEDDSMNPTDGGRISILDFGYQINDGIKQFITIEVGNSKPEVLEEEHRDLDTEVAIVRRRTVAQRRGNRSNVGRSATTVDRPSRSPIPPMPVMPSMPPMPPMPNLSNLSNSFGASSSVPRPNPLAANSADAGETASIDEDDEAFDAPYSQTSPRSGTTLRRAATAAAVNRRLNPRAVAQEHIEYRRADGREEHPHESDADNWVPPPPPYSKDPLPPLPDHIQRSILAEAAAANLQRSKTQRTSSIDFPGLDGNSLQRSRTFASVSSQSSETRRDHFPFPRTRSESMTRTASAVSPEQEEPPVPRRIPSPVSPSFDDLYDVSPPGTPQPTTQRYSAIPPGAQVEEPSPVVEEPSPESTPEQIPAMPIPGHQIVRKPVGVLPPIPPIPDDIKTFQPSTPPIPMKATLQEPVSPMPQPQRTTENLNQRLMHWEATTDPGQSLPSRAPPTPSPPMIAGENNEQLRPSRLLDDRRRSTLLPATPQWQNDTTQPTATSDRRYLEPGDRDPSLKLLSRRSLPPKSSVSTDEHAITAARRAETTPVASKSPAQETDHSSKHVIQPMAGPSADQMARLNSRGDRPQSQMLTDPRRSSVSYGQFQSNPASGQRSVSGPLPRTTSGNDVSPWGSSSDLPLRSTPPRGAVGAHGSSPSYPNTNHVPYPLNSYPQQQHQTQSQSQSQQPYPPQTRRLSINAPANNRLAPIPSPNSLRPNMQRLETIHSTTSVEPPGSPWPQPKRHPSRAERSAAKNIKDAKRRGWRGSMRVDKREKKERDKWADESQAAWTEVEEQMRSNQRQAPAQAQGKGKEKKGKCAVM